MKASALEDAGAQTSQTSAKAKEVEYDEIMYENYFVLKNIFYPQKRENPL